MVFVFYQFIAPPLFFNTVAAEKVRDGELGKKYRVIEDRYQNALQEKKAVVDSLVKARHAGDQEKLDSEIKNLALAGQKVSRLREEGIDILKKSSGNPDVSDTNYIFLNFVINFLPVGLVGLVIAAIVAASMSSTSSELNPC